MEVHVFKESHCGKNELEKVRVEVTIGEGMTIKTQHPQLATAQVSTQLTIQVPEAMIVERLESSNGAIVLEDTTGNATLSTTNGGITIKNVNGSVWAESNNGPIHISNVTSVRRVWTDSGPVFVEISALNENLAIKTSNAEVNVYIDVDIDANLDMQTSHAKIVLYGFPFTSLSSTKNRAIGTIGNGGFEIRINTTNAIITLIPLD